MKDYLAETASQTAGPYVHIGLAPDAAGFHIFEKNFGPNLVSAETKGQRITIEGRVFDGSGTPDAKSEHVRPQPRKFGSRALLC